MNIDALSARHGRKPVVRRVGDHYEVYRDGKWIFLAALSVVPPPSHPCPEGDYTRHEREVIALTSLLKKDYLLLNEEEGIIDISAAVIGRYCKSIFLRNRRYR